jgi:uncharacterized protein (DUF433 family)
MPTTVTAPPIEATSIPAPPDTAEAAPLQAQSVRDLYSISLSSAFGRALSKTRLVTIDTGRVAGAPCIAGTRIPVYAVLDALRLSGSIEGVLSSFPTLRRGQIKEALHFAATLIESPLEYKTQTPL